MDISTRETQFQPSTRDNDRFLLRSPRPLVRSEDRENSSARIHIYDYVKSVQAPVGPGGRPPRFLWSPPYAHNTGVSFNCPRVEEPGWWVEDFENSLVIRCFLQSVGGRVVAFDSEIRVPLGLQAKRWASVMSERYLFIYLFSH